MISKRDLESLTKSLRTRVVRKISLGVEANEAQVLEEILRIEEEVERQRETELVEELITAASKRQKAVLGLDETLVALQEWRIRATRLCRWLHSAC